MRDLIKIADRRYFRSGKGTAYDERGKLCTVWRATSFVEAEMRLTLPYNTTDLDPHDVPVMRDAFLAGNFDALRALAKNYEWSLGFSITGTEGYVCSASVALRESKQNFRGIIEDAYGEDLDGWNAQQGTNYRSYDSAELALWREERENGIDYPGLDVHDTVWRKRGYKSEERVLVTTGCGCIHDTLRETHADLADLIPWHLNTMRSRDDGRSWATEELPDTVLTKLQLLALAQEQRKAA